VKRPVSPALTELSDSWKCWEKACLVHRKHRCTGFCLEREAKRLTAACRAAAAERGTQSLGLWGVLVNYRRAGQTIDRIIRDLEAA
jgi:hypothetical protein